MTLERSRPSRFIVLGIAFGLLALASMLDAQPPQKRTMFVALSDSLGHGTMDGMNNALATRNAFVQLVAERLAGETSLFFNQPYYDEGERRIAPFKIPTNLSVDGSDIFSLEGVEYYERVGAEVSFVSSSLRSSTTTTTRCSTLSTSWREDPCPSSTAPSGS